MFSPRLASLGTQAGGRGVYLKGGGRGFCPGCPGGGGGRGGLVLPRILITCPGSQGTSCLCSLFMIRVEVPGSSFMLCLGPGPPSLLHLTRANAEKPYAGDTERYPERALRNADNLDIPAHNFATLKRLPRFNFPRIWNSAGNEKLNLIQHRFLKAVKISLLQNFH